MNRTANKTATWSDHKRIEARSLAMHRKIATRLRSQPSLLKIAKKNISRWLAQNGAIPNLVAWKELLKQPLPDILAVLVSSSESARDLRQSSPFCGILTPRERWLIYESFTVGTYYQGGGRHR